MKRIIVFFIMLMIVVAGVSGCGSSENGAAKKSEAPKLKIVTTIFPEYSWTKELLGSREKDVELTLLSKKGADMHSYQPSAEDILKIAGCDLFIYVGGESDKWVDKALQEGGNPKRKVISLMKLMGDRAKVEEEVEGMEKHDHHGHDKDKRDEKDYHEQSEYDEHVWLSLKNADIVCKSIAENMAALDPENAETYRANYAAYNKKLTALDVQYKEAVTKSPVKVMLFGDRFPFRYLTDDYGLKYYAAFNGCSAETEASFATVAFLAKKTDELKLPAILTIEGRQHKLAQTIVDNTKAKNQKVLMLNSMQATTEEEMKKGITYLAVMEQNLKVLQEALQAK